MKLRDKMFSNMKDLDSTTSQKRVTNTNEWRKWNTKSQLLGLVWDRVYLILSISFQSPIHRHDVNSEVLPSKYFLRIPNTSTPLHTMNRWSQGDGATCSFTANKFHQ